jgi:membrane protease YdiL (CAAX protease family)
VRDQPEPARLSARCAGCGRELAAAAAFCSACGRATHVGLRAVGERARAQTREARRSVLAIVLAFAGVLAVLLAASATRDGSAAAFLVGEGGLFAVGLAAVAVQGGDAWRASLAGPTRASAAALGLLVGLLGVALSSAWVALLEGVLEGGAAAPALSAQALFVVLGVTVVLPALVEEWLCRGVLWQALERHAPRASVVFLSSLLFALLHMLGGWSWLEVPHRFALGLLLGCLRARSGSLGPCVIAHGTHNLLAVLLRS